MKYLFIFLLFLSLLDAKIYRDSKNPVVLDDARNILWQDDVDNIKLLLTHEEATKYCEELSLAGFNDWRLPDIEEYESIVYKKNTKTNINFAFRYNLRDGYWASKAHWRTLWFYADYMHFVSGTAYYDSRHKKKYVRCVRG
ncbi:hypothetical protein GCM10012288_01240 [Malaciobacter pacificus]|jgi:thioredoxin-related protein|uniref:DUF1566 domain-containing protein n=1 Tax=Malaciobacter pacificus TaxID=1080223 RepID=A0A5C2HAP8_9BACT|nr:DUF1566 domain-containing protein [Malaciobacter pacificus]QEP33382.1 DUF1566 domain-containing protein [Malaciobacter pacificus]GGD30971.1 hypothetical protein GCM10012288_01240 [Malaciobacter pacificus]